MTASMAERKWQTGGLRYTGCLCGEIWTDALRRKLRDGLPICMNCGDTRHKRGYCVACCRTDAPLEQHHLFKRECDDAMIPVCLNCHAMLTAWQHVWARNDVDANCGVYVVYSILDLMNLFLLRYTDRHYERPS